MEKVKIGIIGCGVISNTYIRDIQKFYELLEIVACADVNEELAKHHAEKYKIPIDNTDCLQKSMADTSLHISP